MGAGTTARALGYSMREGPLSPKEEKQPMITHRTRSFGSRLAAVFAGLWLAAPALALGTSPAALAVGAGDSPGNRSEPIPVVVDVRPGIWPNHLKLESALTIPVAILGTMDLDVANIDPGTVRLSRDGVTGECAPVSWAYTDVGVPVIGSSPDCNTPHGDGFDDLQLTFSVRDLVSTLRLGEHIGEAVPLRLTGKIVTGRAIEGIDCAVVMGGPESRGGPQDEIGMLPGAGKQGDGGQFTFAYYTNVSDRITLTIYDARGRLVEELSDADMAPGIYRATWDGTDPNNDRVPAGPYFARVSNGPSGATRKFIVSQ
jgi:hypothetical protein